MRFIKLTVVALALTSLGFLAFGSIENLSQEKVENNQTIIKVDNNLLLQKWKLSHYVVFGSDYKPEKIELNDYIHFHKDNTYSSISEGKYEKGKYLIKGKTIIMTNAKEKGALKLVIKTLTESKLIAGIDDPTDDDAKYVTIHFKTK